jgi:hypothetical protein
LLPVILAGAVKVLVMLTEKQDAVEVMPQALVAVTQMFPLAVPAVATILVLPCPEVMVHPVGTVHVYETAPFTEEMEYPRPVWLGHALAGPEIAPGACMVVIMETAMQVGEETMLQALVAVTQTFPPLLPAFAVMLRVPCPLTSVHPVGSVQV